MNQSLNLGGAGVASTALVTGGAQGLGACIVRALVNAGWQVAIGDVAFDAARQLANDLDPSGRSVLALDLDVSRKSAFEHALDRSLAHFGAVHALVNNAALTQAKAVMEITPEEFDNVISVNLGGCFYGCQVFGRHFAEQGYGRILNMGSLAGQNGGTATGAHYAASKGGIATLTKVFARELAARGVTVNSIAPGPMDLPLVHRIVPADKLEVIKKNIPVGTLGDPDFVGRTVAYLLSDDAGFVTGTTWDINGGLFPR